MTDATRNDLLGTYRNAIFAWWLPIGLMVLAIWLSTGLKTAVWVAALASMGGACIWNHRRCGRVHCRYTGPFLLAMILPVLGHGIGVVPLGADGWRWLGLAIGFGSGSIWYLSEKLMGRYL
jgi:hypothetical protein